MVETLEGLREELRRARSEAMAARSKADEESARANQLSEDLRRQGLELTEAEKVVGRCDSAAAEHAEQLRAVEKEKVKEKARADRLAGELEAERGRGEELRRALRWRTWAVGIVTVGFLLAVVTMLLR